MKPRAGALLGVAACLLAACSKTEAPKPAPSAAASVAATPASVAPPPSATPEKKAPWFAGEWNGSYDAQHYLIEVPKNEGAREWAADDGGAASGEGTLSLRVSDAGAITGTASGPLGAMKVTGEVDGEKLRLRFEPEHPGERSFRGFAVLVREGEALEGRLQTSTGDSRTVRDAAIALHKGPAKPKSADTPEPAPSASAD